MRYWPKAKEHTSCFITPKGVLHLLRKCVSPLNVTNTLWFTTSYVKP